MPITQGIVEFFGVTGSEHECGYCKGMKPAGSDYGMWAHQLKPQEYLLLMDRGWRRSGKYCYYPIRSKTCCPPYAIRCDAKDLQLSKSQRKCLRRVNRFLIDGHVPGNSYRHNRPVDQPDQSFSRVSDMQNTVSQMIRETATSEQQPDKMVKESQDCLMPPDDSSESEKQGIRTLDQNRSKTKDKSNKSKFKRIHRKVQKLAQKTGCSVEEAEIKMRSHHKEKVAKRSEKTTMKLEQLMVQPLNSKHKISIKFVCTSFDQTGPDASNREQKFAQSILPMEHKVYSSYQMTIHAEEEKECSRKQFKRFLIDTPLTYSPFLNNGTSLHGIRGYGSYHMQYWLDDNILIAVGVVDILPSGLSSVYLFYDPTYSFLGLGTYSALTELSVVRSMMRNFSNDFRYYFMGFYIHSCKKMRYKGKFHPSQLLCPEALTWHPLPFSCRLLDNSKYCRLNPDPNAEDMDGRNIDDKDISVLIAGQGVSNYQHYLSMHSPGDSQSLTPDQVHKYAALVGKRAARTLLIYLE